jgi:hypothetical protein
VMFVIMSDADTGAQVRLRDKVTGTDLALQVPAFHAAIALITKQEKKLVATYGL